MPAEPLRKPVKSEDTMNDRVLKVRPRIVNSVIESPTSPGCRNTSDNGLSSFLTLQRSRLVNRDEKRCLRLGKTTVINSEISLLMYLKIGRAIFPDPMEAEVYYYLLLRTIPTSKYSCWLIEKQSLRASKYRMISMPKLPAIHWYLTALAARCQNWTFTTTTELRVVSKGRHEK